MTHHSGGVDQFGNFTHNIGYPTFGNNLPDLPLDFLNSSFAAGLEGDTASGAVDWISKMYAGTTPETTFVTGSTDSWVVTQPGMTQSDVAPSNLVLGSMMPTTMHCGEIASTSALTCEWVENRIGTSIIDGNKKMVPNRIQGEAASSNSWDIGFPIDSMPKMMMRGDFPLSTGFDEGTSHVKVPQIATSTTCGLIDDGVGLMDGEYEEEEEEEDDDDDDVIAISNPVAQRRPVRKTIREALPSELKITLKYRKKEVKCVDVDISNGFRVGYGVVLDTSNVLTFPTVCVPNIQNEADRYEKEASMKEYKLRKTVLENLENGVEFSISNGIIYATRRCRAKVFCFSTQQHNGQDPVKLQQGVPLKIFDYNSFDDTLREFYLNQIGANSIATSFLKPKIFFSFAQGWKPMHDRDYVLRRLGDLVQPTSLNDCLVTMEIVPLRAVDFIMGLPESRDVAESITMSLKQDYLQISTSLN
ncbi:uncharacterized protein [Antedon mediterranea]|uniref:uncharacterized protein n=1 Tax=Antedon mediterranea TaxID=105859 RepID=UPI003AF5E12F